LNTAASLAGLAAITGAAQAAPVDYGAFEELFNEPVTASATGAPQRATDAPVNMTIITQEDIQRSGAIDLPGVLERLASVDVMRFFSGQAEVGVRGYDQPLSPRLLVLVNGRQVYIDHYGMTNWDAIPVQMAEIRQIEVVVGPNTALFGFNAVGGVVNIITYDVLRDDIDDATAAFGDSNYRNGSATLTAQLNERAGARLSVGGLNSDATDADRAITAGAEDPRLRNASLSAAFQLTDRIRADFESTYSNDRESSAAPGGTTFTSLLETTSFKAAISAETGLGMVDAQIYRNSAEIDLSAGMPIGFENEILVASTSLISKPSPAHTLRIAGEYRDNQLEQNSLFTVRYQVLSASGMWNWQIDQNLSLTAALRVDSLELEREGPNANALYPLSNADFDQDMTETSYNLGVVYRLGENDTLRASVARGIQSPSLIEYGMQLNVAQGPVTLIVAGDPTIDPTIVQNYEIGWDRSIAAIGGRLRASLYYQTNEDLKTLQASVTPLAVTTMLVASDNVGDSSLTGFDVGLEGEAGQLHWDVQYSHRDLDDDIITPLTTVQTAYDRSSPQNVVTGGVVWVADAWEVGADARYVDETQQYAIGSAPYSFATVDGYLQVNARAAWRATESATVELIGRNLIEEEMETTSRAAVERAFYVRLSADF